MSRNNQRPALQYKIAAEEIRDNEHQWQAYESTGNFVVLAGPGSGKTKVLTLKMARMLAEDVRPPRGVACITFNAECARELSQKLARLSIRPRRDLFIGTVHSFCLKYILRPFAHLTDIGLPRDFLVASTAIRESVLQSALDAELDRPEDARWYGATFQRYRRTHIDRSAATWLGDDGDAARVIERYEEILHSQCLVDFDDMILGGLQILSDHEWAGRALAAKFPILLIDEYQDLGRPLHELVLILKERYSVRIFVVGDPDQSIYGFTGAEPELLADLAELADVRSVRLKLNYRSRQAIVHGAKIVIQEDRDYEAVDTDEGTIDFVRCPEGVEQQASIAIEQVIPAVMAENPGRNRSDIALLYADRIVGQVVADAADAKGLSYVRLDQGAAYPKTPFSRWLEDCAAWCAGGWRDEESRLPSLLQSWASLRGLGQNRAERWKETVGLVRFLWSKRSTTEALSDWLRQMFDAVVNLHTGDETVQQDDQETWEKIAAAASPGGPLDGFTVRQFGHQVGNAKQLNLITLHSCKGLEFEVVIMVGMDQGTIPRWNVGPGGEREQRRLFYVGLTRAKHEVYMMYSGFTVDRYERVHENGPSKFLVELRDELQG